MTFDKLRANGFNPFMVELINPFVVSLSNHHQTVAELAL
jgi:hypothetical protein